MPRINGIPGEIKARVFQIGTNTDGTPTYVELYQIGDVAKSLGKTAHTIRSWEKKGWLPAADFRSPTGLRLYTREQIEGLQVVLIKYKIKKGVAFFNTKFKEEARKLFKTAQEESNGGQDQGSGEVQRGTDNQQGVPIVEDGHRDGNEGGEVDSEGSLPEGADNSGSEAGGSGEGEQK